jgi:hypothetical protein
MALFGQCRREHPNRSAPSFLQLLDEQAHQEQPAEPPSTSLPPTADPSRRDGFDSLVRNGAAHVHPC